MRAEDEQDEVEGKPIPLCDGWRMTADSRQWTIEKRKSKDAPRSKKETGESWAMVGNYGTLEQALTGWTQARMREGVGLHELGLAESVGRAVKELRGVIQELKEVTKVEVRL